MQRAIEAAKACEQEIAIGAVIVKNGEVISSACNKKEELKDVTAHAEIIVNYM